MMYVQNGFTPKGYWIGTSSDNPVRWLLRRTDTSKAEFSELLAGSSLNRQLNDSISSDRLNLSQTGDLHTLMVLTGYLKAVPAGGWNYSISVPNGEVMEALDRMVSEEVRLDSTRFDEFCLAVLDGDVDRMTDTLQFILVGSSYMTGKAEFPYEAVLMTIMRGIVARYDTRVEREEGNGRVDIVMIPKRDGEPSDIRAQGRRYRERPRFRGRGRHRPDTREEVLSGHDREGHALRHIILGEGPPHQAGGPGPPTPTDGPSSPVRPFPRSTSHI